MSAILEICCFNLPSALIAQEAGADRVELCVSPEEGGVTPSAGLIRTARELVHVDLYPIIRPRGGNFIYSEEEYRVMLRDVELCRHLGCNGVVIGILNQDGSIDKRRNARLVELAYPMGVTFHRAFDEAIHPGKALEDIIAIGCERILSSGQHASAEEGSIVLRELIGQADQRIIIMPGSGVRSSNLADIHAKTGAAEFHSSATKKDHSVVMADRDEVRRMRALLDEVQSTPLS
jgi:copper homeostasis protein